MGKKLEKRNKDREIIILSFVCTMLMCLSLAFLAKLAPFGDNTLIISDSSSQYTSFWSYLRDLLRGEQDPFYALEMTMGNNVLGLIGYYCISPFNFLFLLFPLSKMPLAIHLILMLKLCFSSLFMALFFKNSHSLSFKSLIFTTSYAFCGYILSYSWCLMWLDGFMLLPLIALGLKYIAADKKPWLYIFSLAGAIICNYYIGFMLCIFSVIYFIALLIADGKKPEFKVLGTFAVSSVCAGGLSAVVILPALMSMQNSKRVPFTQLLRKQLDTFANFFISKLPESLQSPKLVNVFPFLLTGIIILICGLMIFFCTRKKISKRTRIAVFSLFCIFMLSYGAIYESNGFFMQKLLIGFTDYDEMTNGFPALYSGIFPLLMAVYFFVSGKTEKREKLAAAFILLILVFSMHFKIPNMVWHGFTTNSMFNYRYAFIFSFILICLGEKAFDRLESFSVKQALQILSVVALLLLLAGVSPKKLCGNLQYLFVVLEVLLVCFSLYLIFRSTTPRYARNCLWGVLALSCTMSVMWQSLMSLKKLSGDQSMSDFQEEISQLQEKADTVKENDKGLYRANIGTRINAPMMFGYNGFSHFSSNEETTVVEFAKKLGVASYENIWSSIAFGRTNALDSFFGVKYTTEPDNLQMYQNFNSDIFQNKNCLPLAFTADSTVLRAEINSDNAFENQNTLFKSVYPKGNEIFTALQMISKEYSNLEKISDNEYVLLDKSKEGKISYKFKADSEDGLYFYNGGFRDHTGKLYLNDDYLSDMSNEFDWRTIYLGSFNSGEEIKLELKLEQGSEGSLSDAVYVCHENFKALNEYCRHISENAGTTLSDTDSRIITSLNVDGDDQTLLYTIPYSKAWHISVDGSETQGEKAFGLMLAVPLGAGEHTVEIKYVPPGLTGGAVISGCCLILMMCTIIIIRKKHKNSNILQQ